MAEENAHDRYSIDRIEDNGWAVLERHDGWTFNVPLGWLPDEAQEGHVLSLLTDVGTKTSTLHFTLDVEETRKRLLEARELKQSLPRGPAGDIEL